MEKALEFFHLAQVIIDSHVHFRGFKEKDKTTPLQVLLEALGSLISISVGMPNTNPGIDSLIRTVTYLGREINLYAQALGLERQQLMYVGLTDNNIKEVIECLKLPQIVGGKIYPLGEVTTGKIGIAKDYAIQHHVCNIAEVDGVLAVHSADPVAFKEKNGDTIEGEVIYLKRILKLTYAFREHLRIVICHVSNRQSVETILEARQNGFRHLYIELAPHYLWFDNSGTNWNPQLDPVFYKCFNALREPKERDYLVSVVAEESVDDVIIGSDSACHITAQKLSNIAPGGIPSNQELVALMITLAKKHGISEERIADLTSFNQAKLFKLNVPKELVLCMIKERTDDLQYNNGIVTNPWNGSRLWFPAKRLS